MNTDYSNNKRRSRQIMIFILKIVIAGILIWSQVQFEEIYALSPESKRARSFPMQMLLAAYTFLIPSIIFSIIRYSFIAIYHARNANRAVRGNFVLGVNRLTAVANAICAIIAMMIFFGINPLEFVTSLTIVAMAIAVTFRDYITNMISGLIIMFSDQLSIGDRIRVGNQQGRIIDITLANIVFQDEEDDMVMVPNNMVFTSTLTNHSAHPSSLFAVKFELPLDVALEVELLESALRESLQAHPNLQDGEEMELKVVEIGKDYVKYRIDLHAVSNSNKLHRRLENEILKEVLKFEQSATAAKSV
ncbi:mechanosensitive ion channel family protein [Sphingobacterium chungjuense]|uniref:mechanosensitive ion channel family protein n=1 Tax=Sphingobacterium chungjuense TaxID=2675553 RepID=UPI001408E40B|nr:mechanosensitive ion channel domain-containing protein [Sphingobacterium chungjuense]